MTLGRVAGLLIMNQSRRATKKDVICSPPPSLHRRSLHARPSHHTAPTPDDHARKRHRMLECSTAVLIALNSLLRWYGTWTIFVATSLVSLLRSNFSVESMSQHYSGS